MEETPPNQEPQRRTSKRLLEMASAADEASFLAGEKEPECLPGEKPAQCLRVTRSMANEVNVDTRATSETLKLLELTAAALQQPCLSKPLLKRVEVMKELQLAEEAATAETEIREMLEAAKTIAAGERGDSMKYEKAAQTVERRWRLYLAVYGYSANKQPTLEMAQEFAVFMFKTRLYRSREDRMGLGDSAVLLARYTLAQKIFPKLGYQAWQGLSTAELQVKAKPFSEVLAETWVRLRRAHPDMKSSAKPFLKEKWSELAVFQAQDAVYEGMDNKNETLNSGMLL